MGMESFISGATVGALLRLAGITVVRVDVHPATQIVILTVVQRGHAHHIVIPAGMTFTAEQVMALLDATPDMLASGLGGPPP